MLLNLSILLYAPGDTSWLFELLKDMLTLDTLDTLETVFYSSFPLFKCDVINACHSNHGNTSVMSLSYVVLDVRSLSKQQVIKGCHGDLLPPCPARQRGFVVMDGAGGSPAPFKSLLFVHLSSLPLLQCAPHFKAASTMKVSKPTMLVFSLCLLF